MVWPALVLRTTWGDRPGPLDGSVLARRSGQELHNHSVITNSPVMAHLRHFFRAAVRDITATYEDLTIARVIDDIKPSICDQMRREIAQDADDFDPSMDQASGYNIPVGESVPPPTISPTTPPPVVDTPRRLLTPNNRALAVLQSGLFVPPQCHMPLARGGGGGGLYQVCRSPAQNYNHL